MDRLRQIQCDCRADIGFALVIRSYDIDRLAKHSAAEVFDGHTGCNDVARAPKSA
jgi:hypothetical protein